MIAIDRTMYLNVKRSNTTKVFSFKQPACYLGKKAKEHVLEEETEKRFQMF